MKRVLLILCLLLLTVGSQAQQVVDSVCADTALIGIIPEEQLFPPKHSFGDFLKRMRMSIKSGIRFLDKTDSTYIEPNHYDWTVMGQNSNFFQVITMTVKTEKQHYQTLSFRPKPMFKIGPYLGWRWIFLGYSVDVSRPSSAGKSTEFDFSVYSSKVGGDIVYIHNNGKFRLRKTQGFDGVDKFQFSGTNFHGLEVNTLSLNAYYIFNHRRFSYPAAYNQSTLQKRSAGSVIMGFRYDKQKLTFDYTQLPSPLSERHSVASVMSDELKFSRLSYQDFCLSAGYAYNWVFAHNWLLASSLSVALAYKQSSGDVTHKRFSISDFKFNNINIDGIGRFGLVWNNSKWYAGMSMILHAYNYRRSNFSTNNFFGSVNLYVGFNFGKRKAKKKEGYQEQKG